MEENIIIKGKKIWFKFRILFLLLANYIGGQIIFRLKTQDFFNSVKLKSALWVKENLHALDDMLASALLPYRVAWVVLFVLIIAYYFYGIRTMVTVTDKRVYGRNGLGKKVDVSLGDISLVRLASHKGVAIVTDTKTIRFPFLKNRKMIYEEINKLLTEKDKPQVSETLDEGVKTSVNIEEIKKYKELLNMGAITQEEFDAKKKQLLNL